MLRSLQNIPLMSSAFPSPMNHLSNVSTFGVYALFICSTVSISASGAITFLLYCVALLGFFTSEKQTWKNPLWWPTLALIGSVALSSWVYFTWSNLGEIREMWRFFLPFVVWKSFQNVRSERLVWAFFTMLVFISVYGIIQHYSGADWFRSAANKNPMPYLGAFHAKGNFSHNMTYGHYLLLAFPLFLSLALNPRGAWPYRLLLFLGSAAMVVGLFLSLARSAWVGAFLAMGIVALRLPRKWLLTLLALASVAGGSFLFSLNLGSPFPTHQEAQENPVKARIKSMSIPSEQRERFALWESALLAIEDHFWLGIGMNNDEKIMRPYRETIDQKNQYTTITPDSWGVHNMYLQTWLNFGLVGLLCYLWFWGTLLFWVIHWLRTAKDEFPFEKSLLWGMFAGFVGFLLAGFFENNFYDGETQTLLLALMGWAFHLGMHIQKSAKGSHPKPMPAPAK